MQYVIKGLREEQMPCDQRRVTTEPYNWITSGRTLRRAGLRSPDKVDKLERELKLVVNMAFYVGLL